MVARSSNTTITLGSAQNVSSVFKGPTVKKVSEFLDYSNVEYNDEVALVLMKYASDKSEEDREDLRHEMFLALLTTPRIDGPGHAYTIARNRLLDIIRLEAYDPETVPIHEDVEEGMVQAHDREKSKREMQLAINLISEYSRKLIIMIYYEGLSETEVGKMLGVSRFKIQEDKKKALNEMKEVL